MSKSLFKVLKVLLKKINFSSPYSHYSYLRRRFVYKLNILEVKNNLLLLVALLLCTSVVNAQDKGRTKNMPKIPKIKTLEMKGGIQFGQPELITGSKYEIRTEKHGLVYPAFFDWNKDGKKDLLLGEFETETKKEKFSETSASCLKVYLNEGTNESPKYSGEYFYAKDTEGGLIAIPAW